MSHGTVAAVDLGAPSGRVTLRDVGNGELRLEAVQRRPSTPVQTIAAPALDILELYRSVLEGLGNAARIAPDLASIGIDSWAVDCGLVRGGHRTYDRPGCRIHFVRNLGPRRPHRQTQQTN